VGGGPAASSPICCGPPPLHSALRAAGSRHPLSPYLPPDRRLLFGGGGRIQRKKLLRRSNPVTVSPRPLPSQGSKSRTTAHIEDGRLAIKMHCHRQGVASGSWRGTFSPLVYHRLSSLPKKPSRAMAGTPVAGRAHSQGCGGNAHSGLLHASTASHSRGCGGVVQIVAVHAAVGGECCGWKVRKGPCAGG
jgi:hypothetical protein